MHMYIILINYTTFWCLLDVSKYTIYTCTLIMSMDNYVIYMQLHVQLHDII